MRHAILSLRRAPFALFCLGVFLLIVAAALLAPWIAPQDPYDNAVVDFFDSNLPPGSPSGMGGLTYWLGTDALGRDLWSAILYGLRITLTVAATASVLALVIGVLAGLVSAYAGGWVDAVIMRLVDILLGFPTILVALTIMALAGAGTGNLILALVVAQWPYYARTARSAALVEIGQDYIDAARCLELPHWRIILRHLLPNAISPIMVVLTLQLAHAVAIEASLSFLGLGTSIERPSLGLLIANGSREVLSGHTWALIYPGLALAALIFTVNVFGDRIRRAMNPQEA